MELAKFHEKQAQTLGVQPCPWGSWVDRVVTSDIWRFRGLLDPEGRSPCAILVTQAWY